MPTAAPPSGPRPPSGKVAARPALPQRDPVAMARMAGYILLLLAALAGLASAAWDTHTHRGSLAPLCGGFLGLGLLVTAVGFRKLEVPTLAFLQLGLLALLIAIAAITSSGARPAAFLLAGRDVGFWSNALCLGNLVLLALVAIPMLPFKVLRIGMGLIFLYGASGFVAGLASGAPLEATILGPGFLSRLPHLYLQPAFVSLNVLLPAALVLLAARIVSAAREGREDLYRACCFLWLTTVIPLAVGIVMMNRFHIANLSWLLAKPRGKGQVEITYTSPWNHAPDGSLSHRILVRTPGYVPSVTPTWKLGGSLARAPRRGEPTTVNLAIKRATTGLDVVNVQHADLTVQEDDQPVPDFKLERALSIREGGTAVVLVLDQSGSMQGSVDDLQRAAIGFVTKLDRSFQLSLVTFSGTVHVGSPFPDGGADNRDTIEKQIAALQLGSSTAVFDAVHRGLELLAPRPATRKLIVLFTDGEDNASSHSPKEVQEAAQTSGVTIHAIGLGKALKGKGEDALKLLSSSTGGTYTFAAAAADLSGAFGSVFDVIACSYVLTFTRPPAPAPPVTIDRPAEGATVPADFAARAVTGEGALAGIALFVDDQQVRECSSTPCETSLSTAGLTEGTHVLRARATSLDGETADTTVTFVVRTPAPTVEIRQPAPGSLIWSRQAALIRVRGGGGESVIGTLDGKPVSLLLSAPAISALGSVSSGGVGAASSGGVGAASSGGVGAVSTGGVGAVSAGGVGADGSAAAAGMVSRWLVIGPGAQAEGQHTLEVRAAARGGATGVTAVSFKVVQPRASVNVRLPPGTVVTGSRAVPIAATCEPSLVPIRSVSAKVDGVAVKVGARAPWSITLNGRSLKEGEHELAVTATLITGESVDSTSRFSVHHPKFHVYYADAGGNPRLDRTRRLVPTIVDEEAIGVDRVEHQVGGKPVAATGPEHALELDPRLLEPGPLTVVTTVFRRDGSRAECTVQLTVIRPAWLDLFVSAWRTGSLLPPVDFDRIGLSVKLDATPVPVGDVARASAIEIPLIFGLVLDCSGSMTEENKFTRAKEAASYFIELKRAGDQAALISFSDHAKVEMSLELSRSVLRERISLLSPEGSTALYDGIATGVGEVRRGANRRALFVLSDGVDQNRAGTGPGSTRTLDEALELAREAGVALYTIGLGPELRARGAVGERVLMRLAGATGGSYSYAPGGSALQAVFKSFSEQVRSQTHLRIQSPDLEAGRRYRVTLSAAEAGVELVYPGEAVARDGKD